MRLTPSTRSRGAGFDPLEVSEGVSLDPLVGSEGVPYPLKSFEGVWLPSSFLVGVYERNFTVIMTKVTEIFSAREKVPDIFWSGTRQKTCIHEPARLTQSYF